MSGEQVLRAAILKQMHGCSYPDLTFGLADSPTFRTFCRIGMVDEAPKKATLADNIKRVKPETMEAVNKLTRLTPRKPLLRHPDRSIGEVLG